MVNMELKEFEVKIINYIANLFYIKNKRKIKVAIVRIGCVWVLSNYWIGKTKDNDLPKGMNEMVYDYSYNILNG